MSGVPQQIYARYRFKMLDFTHRLQRDVVSYQRANINSATCVYHYPILVRTCVLVDVRTCTDESLKYLRRNQFTFRSTQFMHLTSFSLGQLLCHHLSNPTTFIHKQLTDHRFGSTYFCTLESLG